MRNILLPLFLIMWGCSTPSEIVQRTIDNVIRYDTVKVTLPADVRYDTVYITDGQGESVKYIVKVDTHKVYIKGKEKIVYVPVVDTITITRTETVQKDDEFFDITLKETLLIVLGIVGLAFITNLVRK